MGEKCEWMGGGGCDECGVLRFVEIYVVEILRCVVGIRG